MLCHPAHGGRLLFASAELACACGVGHSARGFVALAGSAIEISMASSHQWHSLVLSWPPAFPAAALPCCRRCSTCNSTPSSSCTPRRQQQTPTRACSCLQVGGHPAGPLLVALHAQAVKCVALPGSRPAKVCCRLHSMRSNWHGQLPCPALIWVGCPPASPAISRTTSIFMCWPCQPGWLG